MRTRTNRPPTLSFGNIAEPRIDCQNAGMHSWPFSHRVRYRIFVCCCAKLIHVLAVPPPTSEKPCRQSLLSRRTKFLVHFYKPVNDFFCEPAKFCGPGLDECC